jgi:DNA-3-methyladenine glycosylase
MSHVHLDAAEPLPRAFYARPTLQVASDLLGKTLWRSTLEGVTAGMIVETEAYIAAIDPASHGYRGPTPRIRSSFGPAGYAYVYRSYGIHVCLNVVTETAGVGAAVLLRALQPTVGKELMRQRRAGRTTDRNLLRGPGRLCQAMGITLADDGADLLGPTLWISETSGFPAAPLVATTPRIGLSRATEWPWRFVLVGNGYVSGKGVQATSSR